MREIEEHYKKYSRNVYYYILSKVHSPDIAEELTQEVFFRGIKSYKKYRGESSPLTWLIGIAKNVCLEYFRKSKMEALVNIEGDKMSSENVEQQYEQKKEVIELYRKIKKLDQEKKEVVYLRLTGELSFAEIGEIMGRTETWARTNFYRAKQILKEGF